MTMFDHLNAPSENVIDTVGGEEFAFQPMRQVKNGTPVDDISRSPVECFIAIFSSFSERVEPESNAISLQVRNPRIIVRKCFVGGENGVRRGDRFIRKCDGITYEARAVRPEGIERITIEVVET